MKPLIIALLGLATAVLPLEAATHYFNGTDFKGGYVVIPDALPANGAKMWVAVQVHGAGGLKREGGEKELIACLSPEPLIVIVPAFSDGYQAGDGVWAKQLLEHFEWVKKNHPVHDRMFVHGFSGGGQFAHRFAFSNPKSVLAVSAHSAGSWACAGGYGAINKAARGIPFVISCGEGDTGLSTKESPHNRLEWYRLFEAEMQKEGFVYWGGTWPGVGHAFSMSRCQEQIRECFALATQAKVPASQGWKGDAANLNRQLTAGDKPAGGGAKPPSGGSRLDSKRPSRLDR